MSSHPDLPAGGYLRMPLAWLSLPVSPQAKTLLTAFCGFADREGRSYYSYEQLGEMIGRSKASIAAYVRELRDLDIIDCTRQTYGNGYNYRLLIQVRGWADILALWAEPRTREGRRVQDVTASEAAETAAAANENSERSIQPAEHKDPSGPITQIHQNHSRRAAPAESWSVDDEKAWRAHRPSDRDPASVWQGTPPPDLRERLARHVAALQATSGTWNPEQARKASEAALQRFGAARKLTRDPLALTEAAKAMGSLASTPEALQAALGALEAAWQPHWRRLSSPAQIAATVGAAVEGALPPREQREALGRFTQRLWILDLQARGRSRAA